MIGYVIWQNPVDGTALIWCSDHGELAHFDPKHAEEQNNYPLKTNDQVKMVLSSNDGLRRVVEIVQVWSGRDLNMNIQMATTKLVETARRLTAV